ncbi:hypothetical protein BMI86_01965 [Thioclava sp. DLFJ5-1]|uniref:DUF5337 family protein n=1 Tax=Thioclava sp. DLFJ5-1 TaxID=1915314 RepID=UPI000995E32C|nr:DUF5337 family protein [Thioclava sp. DLFJ5-1]OOY21362.1 hypothetical protein BMI86_01965 [Thioclava sp. DLFJ5-1]
MSQIDEHDRALGRRAALIIAVATILWLLLQWIGQQQGWSAQVALIGDLAAIAAYIYALALVWRIWRRKSGK